MYKKPIQNLFFHKTRVTIKEVRNHLPAYAGHITYSWSKAIYFLEETTMTPSINAVGFTLEQKQSDMIESKLKRISYGDDLIVDLLMKIKHDKTYVFDTTVNFKWGTSAHVSGEDFDFGAALNKMMDVLDNKIKKEKDKVQGK